MCIVTRDVKDEEHLIRFVRSPDGEAVPDLKGSLPGAGVWVSLGRGKVAEAQRKRLFSRGFHADTQASETLPELVGGLLRRLRSPIYRLARKAGQAVCGFMKVGGILQPGQRPGAYSTRRKHAKTGGESWPRRPARASKRLISLPATNWIWRSAGQMWYMLPWLAGGLPTNSSRRCGGSRHMRPVEASRQ